MKSFTVTSNEAGQRLDKLLAKYLNLAPKGFCYKMLRKKNITLNGKKAQGNEMLQLGDEISFFLSDETIAKFSKTAIQKAKTNLNVIYEDSHILLINKPVGMLSQKAEKEDVSLVEYLITYLLDSGSLTEAQMRTFKPSVCNRLDRNTSGLVVAGKTLAGLQIMSEQLKERKADKYYRCIVSGKIKSPQLISGYLVKDPKTNKVSISKEMQPDALPIQTEYIPIQSCEEATLLEVHLITGRTHQIRAHLCSIGHPIIGDYKYGHHGVNDGFRKKYGLKSQLLHSYRLEFHQVEEPLANLSNQSFQAEEPALMRKIEKDLFSGKEGY